MGIEQKDILILRPGTEGELTISCPEDLARYGIGMHGGFMRNIWGPDAEERYKQTITLISRPIHPCAPVDRTVHRAEDGWPQRIIGDGFPVSR